jgi:lysophospholipase L1-like esterase
MRSQSRLSWSARAFAAVILGLVCAEVALQGIVWANRTLRTREVFSAPGAEGGRVWVCVGDSCTFGIFEDAGDSYPAQLERLLNERDDGDPVRVVNLGLPALNTRQVKYVLEEAVRDYDPEFALVLTGVNNTWSWQPDGQVDFLSPPWYEGLRLVRMARLIRFAFDEEDPRGEADLPFPGLDPETGDVQVNGRDRTGRRIAYATQSFEPKYEGAILQESIVADLEAIAASLRGGACSPVFLTYASDEEWYGPANRAIREAARRTGTTLVDCERNLAESRATYPNEILFYPDSHPRALGYELVARAVLQGMTEAGLVQGDPFDTIAGDLATPSLITDAPSLIWESGADGLPLVEIDSKDPQRPYVVMISAAEGDRPLVLDGLELPIFDDDIHRDTRLASQLTGVTNKEGRARVLLTDLAADDALDQLRGRRFRVAYVLYQNRYGGGVRRISEAVEFVLR